MSISNDNTNAEAIYSELFRYWYSVWSIILLQQANYKETVQRVYGRGQNEPSPCSFCRPTEQS